jgi:TnpA family transposase
MDHRSVLTEDDLRDLIQFRMHGIDEGPVVLSDADNHVADMQFSATRRGPARENSVYIDLVNYASCLPLSRVYGRGASCSADGVRFYVPVNLLAADYSHVLQGRGVTLYAHTADNCLRLHQQPIPCRLREAAFVLDGLLEHDTDLDPRTCYTDTHGYTEVVMATAALLGFELAPRIRDIHDQTLYKLDHSQHYPHLDPILTGAIKAHRITPAWDEVVRLVASMSARVVSPSLALLRLGSYARQNRIHQALAEIGRIHKTIHILRTLDDEEYRRRMGRELNKGEASHELSRFLCFGKEGALRGREFGDQLHTFSCCRCCTTRWWPGTWCTSSPSSSSYEPRASVATMSCSA